MEKLEFKLFLLCLCFCSIIDEKLIDWKLAEQLKDVLCNEPIERELNCNIIY